MIKDLGPEVRNNMHLIAVEEVKVKGLEEQISNLQAKLAKDKEHLLQLKTDLAAGKETYQYADRTFTTGTRCGPPGEPL